MLHPAKVTVKENVLRGFRSLKLPGMLNELMSVATLETYLDLKWSLH